MIESNRCLSFFLFLALYSSSPLLVIARGGSAFVGYNQESTPRAGAAFSFAKEATKNYNDGDTIITTTTTATTIPQVLDDMRKQHEAEMQRGFEIFQSSAASNQESGGGAEKQQQQQQQQQQHEEWRDADFSCRHVPPGLAGPDEDALGGCGNCVFTTTQPVFTKEECENLILETREAIARGLATEDRSDPDGRSRTNSELGEARVSTLPRAREWLQNAMREKLLPLLESRFGIPANELTLHDSLVIGYGYFGPAKSQPVHRDASIISLNVALSPIANYSANGGGTYFEGLTNGGVEDEGESTTTTTTPTTMPLLKMEQGHVMCHAGGNMHAGNGITEGERWVLVLFVLAKNQPQLARRCHASGMLARQEGDLQMAETMFQAGLTVAPNDHLLHFSLGGVYSAQGHESKARDCLRKTFGFYPLNPQPMVSLGDMLMSDGEMQAALGVLEKALDEGIQDRDLLYPKQPGAAWTSLQAMGFETRVQASHCALVLCTQHQQQQPQDGGENIDDLLSRLLPPTIKRLETCLAAAPGHPRLLSMMEHAKKMLPTNNI